MNAQMSGTETLSNRKPTSNTRLIVYSGLSLLLLAYCLAGVITAIWLSATPNFPHERAVRDVTVWAIGTFFCIALAGWCSVMIWKRFKKHQH